MYGIKFGDIDTAAPFESVNEAVSIFGAIVDRKLHKVQTTEKNVYVEQLEKTNDEIALLKSKFEAEEEAKLQVLKDLDSTKRLIEELKLNLERAQTEEHEAKQDSELVPTAVAELATVKNELESLHKDYDILVSEKDIAAKIAREAATLSKDVEKQVENLTIQLMITKESLESTNAAHLEAEKHRIEAAMKLEQDALDCKQELKQTLEEFEKVNQQIDSNEYQKCKVDTSTSLLRALKTELAAYKESKLARDDLEKNGIQAKEEIDYLKVDAGSLQTEIEKEKAALAATRRREAMTVLALASLEAELNQTRTEISHVQIKETEAQEQMAGLSERLQMATREAYQAKSRAQEAREEVKKAKQIAEQAKRSEKLALAAIDALHGQETRVTVSLAQYYELSKKAHEAKEAVNTLVSEIISLIDVAKESESKRLSKLEQLTSELAARKQAFDVALQKAEKANQRKLGVEQDLRKWRAEHGQRRKSGLGVGPIKDFKELKRFHARPVSPLNHNSRLVLKTTEYLHEARSLKKQKGSVFPRVFMALRKKET